MYLLAVLLVVADQSRGLTKSAPLSSSSHKAHRAVVASHILLVTQLLQNSLGKNLHAISRCKMTTALAHLAQFDTHLVVRVDSPDRALHMDLVLVHCDQGSECSRRKLLEHYTVRRLVALKDLGLDKGSV